MLHRVPSLKFTNIHEPSNSESNSTSDAFETLTGMKTIEVYKKEEIKVKWWLDASAEDANWEVIEKLQNEVGNEKAIEILSKK